MTGGLTDIAFGTVKRQTLLFMYMGEEVEHQPGDDEQPTLEPIETCYIVARDVPVTVKAQLMIIKYKRGWKSWAEMIYDVVKEWGGED